MISNFAKSIAFLISAGFTALVAANTDGTVTLTEWVNVIIAIIGAALVYAVPNLPDGVKAYAKTIAAALIAALTAISSALITPGITTNEWLQVGLAALGALGVFIIPNTANSLVNSVERKVLPGQ